MLVKHILLFLFVLQSIFGAAQTIEASSYSLAGSEGQLPFWLWANQLGRYDSKSSAQQNFELNSLYQSDFRNKDFYLEAKALLNLSMTDEYEVSFTELYADINWKFLQAQIGAFAEKELFQGLSTSNDNIASSRNARPHPKIRLGFNRFVPLFTKWVSVNGFYEEGLLNDDRYVEDTHLHRKAFYLRLGKPGSLQITGGVEHFVMWGGTHPVYGDLQSWEEYFSYVKSSKGSSTSLLTDQINVMGNAYGCHQLKIENEWDKLAASLYLSHPFDDISGMDWVNAPDNLIGLFVDIKKEHAFLTSFLIEYFNTKDQSGQFHQIVKDDGTISGSGRDDYFNHGIYQSGATYQQMSMVSPLFAPVIIEDGISMGFESTRFTGFHLGAKGNLSQDFQWQAKYTYSNNFGKHDGEGGTTYDPSRKQNSAFAQLSWQKTSSPLYISVALAADKGSLYDEGEDTTRLGAMLSLHYKIN